MNLQPLPVSPEPYPDELMSSWLERIGLFYGIGCHGVIAVLAAYDGRLLWDSYEDLDAEAVFRRSLSAWTGRSVDGIPALLDPSDPGTMPPPTRMTYCAKCWDEDVAVSRQPYIRSHWTRWTTVHCSRHQTWLRSRRPRTMDQNRTDGWIGIWRSKGTWASAFDRSSDSLDKHTAAAFLPGSFQQPTAQWHEFEADVATAIGRTEGAPGHPFVVGSILGAVVSHDFAVVRRDVRAALQRRPAHIRIEDFDFIQYRHPEPVWIANRIACLVIAAEIVRLLDDRPPLFPCTRRILAAAECVWKLRADRSSVVC